MDTLGTESVISVLSPSIAAKIAAGEVIDRPASVVRELLDNAIDSGASQISLYLEGGGLQLIRVTDDGFGMSQADLELCHLAHATSKIRNLDDLLQLQSLGFRGEALASIAACSRMRIVSMQEGGMAWELSVADSQVQHLKLTQGGSAGTLVEVWELFYSLPPRRKFLKNPRTEALHCKNVFYEKALAFPHLHFRLFQENKLIQHLPPGRRKERIGQIYEDLDTDYLSELREETRGMELTLYAAPPEIYRKDRKRMLLYINNRPIVDSVLQQAMRLGYNGYLAGGLFPVCFCFLELPPDRVDFNVHPMKREVRLRDMEMIRAAISQQLRRFCQKMGTPPPPSPEPVESGLEVLRRSVSSAPMASQGSIRSVRGREAVPSSSFSARDLLTREPIRRDPMIEPAQEISAWESEGPVGKEALSNLNFRYLGQVFGVFLLVERGRELYLIDQHASHERLLYETLEEEMLRPQKLLFPIRLSVESAEVAHLREKIPLLSEIGIQLRPSDSEEWEVISLPPCVSDLREEIQALILDGASTVGDLKSELFAHLCCRKAIKKGDDLDDATAIALIGEIFAKNLDRCPHGRPIWFCISDLELFQHVQRT